nr:hypothetical protein [uncultured Campylobacter sp.]
MSDEIFKKTIAAIIAVWAISICALVGAALYLQSKCSIISYIANGN